MNLGVFERKRIDKSSTTKPMLRYPKTGLLIKSPKYWAKANIKNNSAIANKSIAKNFEEQVKQDAIIHH